MPAREMLIQEFIMCKINLPILTIRHRYYILNYLCNMALPLGTFLIRAVSEQLAAWSRPAKN